VNVLFSLDNYSHGSGGAERCVQALALAMAERGHSIRVLQEGRGPASHDDGPVRVHARPLPNPQFLRHRYRDTLRWNRHWRPLLEEFLSKHPTDLIVTQNRLLLSSVSVAADRGIPVVVMVHAYAMFCPTQFRARDALAECSRDCKACLPWRLRMTFGAVERALHEYEGAFRRASVVVANSQYVQKVIRRFYDIDAPVMYPAIDLRLYQVEGAPDQRECTLFVKPQDTKGLPIFLEVAKCMQDRRFLVAGASRRRARELGRLENVECMGWTDDMRQVYGRTRVLLGPSIWQEPFGRVFVEAGASGIPSVASARGGIPEAVGDGGILIHDIFDISRWVEALRKLDDPMVYGRLSANARRHARQLAAGSGMQRFAEIVRGTIGLAL